MNFKYLLFIMILFTSFSFAQNELDNLGYLESEDIACEDLPSAFNKYEDDVELNQLSLQRLLSRTAEFLRNVSKDGQIVKEELLEMIENLKEVSALSADNSFLLSDQAYNIAYALPNCVESKSSSGQ